MSGAVSAATLAALNAGMMTVGTATAISGAMGTMGTIMSVATPIMSVVGSVAQARGEQQAGEASKYAANYEAAQLKNQSNTVAAEGERKAEQQDMQTKYLLSQVGARAAAGGTATTDPSTQNVMQTIAGQGRLRSLMDIYQGQQGAQNLQNTATGTAYGGQLAEQAGATKGMNTIIGGGSSLFSKYWPATPTGGGSAGTVPDPSMNYGMTPMPFMLPSLQPQP